MGKKIHDSYVKPGGEKKRKPRKPVGKGRKYGVQG